MNKELYGKTFEIPLDILNHLELSFNKIDSDSNTEGFNRNKTLRSNKKINYQSLKRWKNWFDSYDGDSNSPEYILNGGEKCKNWVNRQLDFLRKKIEQSKKNKKYGEGNLDVKIQVIDEIKRINNLILK